MYTQLAKKLVPLCILDILKKYSDKDHKLSKKDIAVYLKNEYEVVVDRKTLSRALVDLKDYGFRIEYSEVERKNINAKTGEEEENNILTDFYLEHDFAESELRLLADSILFSKHIPMKQCKELLNKIEGLSSVYFKSRMNHIHKTPENRTDNKQVFYNIDLLDEAIVNKRKVSFKYLTHDTSKKLHVRKTKTGEDRVYVINPYQMAAKDGKYYLICNADWFDDISNYRIDRIYDLKILDAKVKPFRELKGANGDTLNLEEYMKEHVYMFTAEKIHAKFTVEPRFIDDVIDAFGKDVRMEEEKDGTVLVTTTTNRESMIIFAKSLAPWVVVKHPEDVAKEIKDSLKEALKKYK